MAPTLPHELTTARMSTRVLIVEPDPAVLSSLLQGVGSSADADGCTSFSVARVRLGSNQYERLFTNLRLEAHNGLHLVYLARSRALKARCVVYTEQPEFALAQEVQDSGAFYESRDRLLQSIRGYVESDLPSGDRRHPSLTPRRAAFRGGRRCSDQPVHVAL
jgi:DNA-binding NtrC family response regulator